MRRNNTEDIKSIINTYLKELNIDNKLKEVEAVNNWEEIIGKAISRRTEKIYIRNRTLFLQMNSSVARNEILLIKDGIKEAINNKMGEQIIDDIVIR